MQLTPQAVYSLARDAAFSPDQACNALGVCKAESGFDPYAVGINKGPNASVDRGIAQINSWWHAEATNEQCFVPRLALIEMYRISSQGSDFSPWYGWTTGAGQVYAIAFRKVVELMEKEYQQSKLEPDAGEFAMSLGSAIHNRRMGLSFAGFTDGDWQNYEWLIAQKP